jgi:hypothetical protein
MNNNISLIETDQLNYKIQMIMRQTDYDESKTLEKLKVFDFNEINVIKDYVGIIDKKSIIKSNSINQDIYKQFRKHLVSK